MFNPLVAATSKEFEVRESALRSGESSILSISENGLWLRQGNDTTQTVIRAAGSNLDGTELQNVTFLTFVPETGPTRRIEAASAILSTGAWELADARFGRWAMTALQNSGQQRMQHCAFHPPSPLIRSAIALASPHLSLFGTFPHSSPD